MTTQVASFDDPRGRTRNGAGIRRASRLARLLVAAIEAGRDYERLSHLSDDALARRGIRRADLPRAILERLTRAG